MHTCIVSKLDKQQFSQETLHKLQQMVSFFTQNKCGKTKAAKVPYLSPKKYIDQGNWAMFLEISIQKQHTKLLYLCLYVALRHCHKNTGRNKQGVEHVK